MTMFDFGNANEGQKQAISAVDGPVLITAGPGTGKTFTLVQRAIYLIQEKGIRPEEILLATFTDKAAKELITRITNELAARGIIANINEMYIGTFHSLCLRIIKEHLEFTRLKKNFRTLDAFDQSYTVFQNIYRFRGIKNFDTVVSSKGAWKQAGEICTLVNNLSEELINPEELIRDGDIRIAALGEIFMIYQTILSENNLMDFSAIQTEAYWLLTNYPEVLAELHAKIHYIMIDEYQDKTVCGLLSGNGYSIPVPSRTFERRISFDTRSEGFPFWSYKKRFAGLLVILLSDTAFVSKLLASHAELPCSIGRYDEFMKGLTLFGCQCTPVRSDHLPGYNHSL